MGQCYWKSKVNCTFSAVHGTLCTGVVEGRWIPACLQFSWVFTQRNWRKLLLSKSLRTEGFSSPSTTSFPVMTTSKKGLWISGCFFIQMRHCAELLADCMFTFCEAGFHYWAESLLPPLVPIQITYTYTKFSPCRDSLKLPFHLHEKSLPSSKQFFKQT